MGSTPANNAPSTLHYRHFETQTEAIICVEVHGFPRWPGHFWTLQTPILPCL